MMEMDSKEETREAEMDQVMEGEEEQESLPADASETVYVKNLNEGVKVDGGCLFVRRPGGVHVLNCWLSQNSFETDTQISLLALWAGTVCHGAWKCADEGTGVHRIQRQRAGGQGCKRGGGVPAVWQADGEPKDRKEVLD